MIRNVIKGALCSAVLLTTGLVTMAPAQAAQASQARRPNILLIISDDIGMDASSDMYPGLIDSLARQYGPAGLNHPQQQQVVGRPASTPNLNALSQAGMRFTQAWANPFCSATRAAILAGLYAVKTEVLDYTRHLTQSHHSFARDLKEKGGYSTAIFGKWHIAGLGQYPGMKPKEAGFDLFRGNLHGGVATYWQWDYHVQDAASAPGEWRQEPAPTRSLPGIAPTTYAAVVKTADTIDWITEQEKNNPDKPWFVWLAHNLAHITGNQQPNPMAVPNIDTLDDRSRKEMESCGGTFGSAIVGRCTDKQLMRAMTNSMDTLIGRVLQTVDALDPNTYVIYVGDNGTWMFGANREFIDNMYITRVDRSKGTAYESGVRVPFVIRGPRIGAGTSSDVPTHSVDLFATILQLAGLEVPKTVPNRAGDRMIPLDAVSLTPVLFQGARQVRDPDREYLLTETINPVKQNTRQAGARNGRYKVICTNGADNAACEFYDLREDPLEEYPLSKPASCAQHRGPTPAAGQRDWHFCRLQDVLAKESFLSMPAPPPAAPARGGRPVGPARPLQPAQ
jgi:arylsulfatase A-like enzyme